MKSYIFSVAIMADAFEDGRSAFHASCPALPGCHRWGHTRGEALSRIGEAIELYVEDLRAAGEAIPVGAATGIQEWPTPAVAVTV